MSTEQQQPAPQACATCGKPPSDVDEAVTHCEWCGAEYPDPQGEGNPAGS